MATTDKKANDPDPSMLLFGAILLVGGFCAAQGAVMSNAAGWGECLWLIARMIGGVFGLFFGLIATVAGLWDLARLAARSGVPFAEPVED